MLDFHKKNSPEIRRVNKSSIPEQEPTIKALVDLSQKNKEDKNEHKLFNELIKPGSIPNYKFSKDSPEDPFCTETFIDINNKNIILDNSSTFNQLKDEKGVLLSISHRNLFFNQLKVELYFPDAIRDTKDRTSHPKAQEWKDKFKIIYDAHFDNLLTLKQIELPYIELLEILKIMNIQSDQVFTNVKGEFKRQDGKIIEVTPNGLYKLPYKYYEGILEGLKEYLFDKPLEAKVLEYTQKFLHKIVINLPLPIKKD